MGRIQTSILKKKKLRREQVEMVSQMQEEKEKMNRNEKE